MKRTRTFIFASFFSSAGFSLWHVIFNNYAVETFGVTATQAGLAQSLREIPGLLVFTVAFLSIFISELKIACLTVILVGLGCIFCGFAQTYVQLLAGTFILSIGFHYFYAIQQSAGTKLMKKGNAAHFFSRLRSLGASARLTVSLIAFLLIFFLSYGAIFRIIGSLILLGGLYLLLSSRGKMRPVKAPKIRLRKEYSIYYAINFLMGLRRHIFTTFAVFLLVKHFGVPAKNIILLIFTANVIAVFLFRYYGHVINYLGGKNTMRMEFSILALLFLSYAFVRDIRILFVLYILDALLFGFSSAVDVYLKDIVKTRVDSTMTVSAGFAINHITAVIIPVAGGLLWDNFSYQLPFFIGSGVALFSVLFISMDKIIMNKILKKI